MSETQEAQNLEDISERNRLAAKAFDNKIKDKERFLRHNPSFVTQDSPIMRAAKKVGSVLTGSINLHGDEVLSALLDQYTRNPNGTFTEIIKLYSSIPEEISEKLNEVRDKYTIKRAFGKGKTRFCFLAECDEGMRTVKLDMPNPEGVSAEDAMQKGYNSRHDAEIRIALNKKGIELGLGSVSDHNIVMALDVAGKDDYSLVVEDFVACEPGSERQARTLDSLVRSKGHLNEGEFKKVFTQLFDAFKYISDCGVYHRDIKPENILVTDSLDAYLTDFGIACWKDEAFPKVEPSSGARDVMDPLMCPVFTGDDSAEYSDISEAYEIGMNMLFALTGSKHIKYDRKNGTAVVIATGESILDDKGMLDNEKHDKALEEALNLIPEESQKYSCIIRKCLASDKSMRYDSISKLAEDAGGVLNE